MKTDPNDGTALPFGSAAGRGHAPAVDSPHTVRWILSLVLAAAFAGMCAVATYAYLDHRPRIATTR